MSFEIGKLAILNEKANSGLPDRVGEVVRIANPAYSSNFDYHVELDDGDLVPVKEKELNHLSMSELDLTTYIKKGNKVLYAPMDEEVEIVKVDYLHGQAEVKFYDSAMSIIDFEQLRPIEEKEEVKVEKEYKFQIGDCVKVIAEDQWNGMIGEVSGIQHYDCGTPEYLVDIDDKIGCPFVEEELELVTEDDKTKAYYLDLFFGHYENEDGTFTLPRQLLHNLLNKAL